MSEQWLEVLQAFANAPERRILCADAFDLFDEPHIVLALERKGYLRRGKVSPNARRLIPDAQRDEDFFSLTSDGYETYRQEFETRARWAASEAATARSLAIAEKSLAEAEKGTNLASKSLKVSVAAILVSLASLALTFLRP